MGVSLNYRLLFISQILSSLCIGQDTESIAGLCEESGQNCKTCINAHPQCSWCSENNKGTEETIIKRCKLYSENMKTCMNSTGHASETITSPSSYSVLERNEEFTEAGPDFFSNIGDAQKNLVQIRPQEITVKLRKGQPTKAKVKFQKVVDFPLDIYFVMDLSGSMGDDLEMMKGISTRIFNDIRDNVTKNVQIGFGSFVDKVVNPFTSTEPELLSNPCTLQNEACAPPFGFRHQLSITGNSSEFAETVKKTKVSSNIDKPEGSFDALMQIAVCKEIGWRRGSTKMVLLMTDDTPHFAMDGRVAAILEVNDMKCHLEKGVNSDYPEDMVYAKSKTMDYPSLGQLREVFDRNKIHSIFAVTDEMYPLYKGIEEFLDDAYVVVLAEDSNNIEDVIAETYNRIKETLSISVTAAPIGVRMTHKIFCPRREPLLGGKQCDGIVTGNEVEFEFEFSIDECPASSRSKDQVVLSSTAFPEGVTFNLEYLCDCDCQNQGESNSSLCSNKGELQCGQCVCDADTEGSRCQCPAATERDQSCRNTTDAKSDCEGHGICECGVCVCQPPYIGKFCQCQSTGCPSADNKICGGSEKGRCENCNDEKDKCKCFEPYSIRPSDKTCSCDPNQCKVDKSSNVSCSGRGWCDCTNCVCNETDVWSGPYCDECVNASCTGLDMSCDGAAIRDCVKCQVEKGDCAELCAFNVSVIFETVDSIPDCSKSCSHGSLTSGNCKKYRANLCSYNYQVAWTDNNQFLVYMKKSEDTDCPKPPDPLTIVLPIAAATILIGILSIIAWKRYLKRQDKKQYKAFLDEIKSGKWVTTATDIYQEPIQRFVNPAFQGQATDD